MSSSGEPAESSSRTTACGPKSTLVARLREAGIDTKRFVPAEHGTKKVTDHESREPCAIADSYGVMGGAGLLLVDVDDPQHLPEAASLPPTFTVATPHGGEHLYYRAERDGLRERKDWGELRGERWYCIGPGTELESCEKNNHDCSRSGEGRYTIRDDRPIAWLDNETIDLLANCNSNETETEGVTTSSASVPSIDRLEAQRPTLSTQERERLKMALRRDRTLALLWDGRYRDAGFEKSDGGVDRSKAEYRLAARLRFWLMYGLPGDIGERVATAMTISAKRTPWTAGGERRKWADQTHGNLPLYRAETVARAVYDLSTGTVRCQGYTPPEPPRAASTDGGRPMVSWPTICRVERAVADLGQTSTTDLLEHDAVNRGKRQVQRALRHLIDTGNVERIREGRRQKYRVADHDV